MSHTRKQVMAKRRAVFAVVLSRPADPPIVVDGVYHHIYAPRHSQRVLFDGMDPARPQLISNSTGRAVQ